MRKIFLGILAALILILIFVGGYFVSQYNALVVKDQAVSNAQANVETQLQRRFDLIPNLVNSTKGFLTQEQTVFSDIAEARTQYSGAQPGTREKVDAANALESSIGKLLVIVENYPELKSDATVQGLMDELAGTENRIAVERKRFNDIATEYNTMIKKFPTNLFAGTLGFSERALFQAQSEAQSAPVVNLQ